MKNEITWPSFANSSRLCCSSGRYWYLERLLSLFDTYLFTSRLIKSLTWKATSFSNPWALKCFSNISWVCLLGGKNSFTKKKKKVNINSVATMVIPKEQAYLSILNSAYNITIPHLLYNPWMQVIYGCRCIGDYTKAHFDT